MHTIHDDQRRADQRRTEKANRSLHGACSRRVLLKHMAVLGAAGLLSACGGENRGGRSVTGGPCAASGEPSGPLSHEKASRRAVNYVDESPHSEKICSNCRFFKRPDAGADCGGCDIVPGPIAPAGYCNAWAARNG